MSQDLLLRPAIAGDVAACIALRGRTRENPVSAARLAELGITEASWGQRVAAGSCAGWVALDEHGTLLGYAYGQRASGEVEVLALLPEAEGQGLGRRLLQAVVDDLRAHGHIRPWLMADATPTVRAHGFYRHLGWRPRHTDRPLDAHGDEALELPEDAMRRAAGPAAPTTLIPTA